MQATPVLHLVTCGSVDDGKSTLIGRLLAETDSVPVDQLEYARTTRRGGSTIPIGEVDFSNFLDLQRNILVFVHETCHLVH